MIIQSPKSNRAKMSEQENRQIYYQIRDNLLKSQLINSGIRKGENISFVNPQKQHLSIILIIT